VQENAMRAWSEQRNFRELLNDDGRVDVDPAVLDAAFDLRRSLKNIFLVFDQLDAID
jgi:Adenylosuccinate lyase C-terminus